MATGFTPTFIGAGVGSRAGAVPNPGADTPPSYTLRADATWGPGPAGSQQGGEFPLTVLATHATVTLDTAFAVPYEAPPNVICSSSNEELLANASGITAGGFIAQMTAATPTVVDTSGTFTYLSF